MDTETKEKISKALKGKTKSPEHAAKCRVAALGSKHGRPPQERIERIREANKRTQGKNKKLTWDDVREIRLMKRIGKSTKEIVGKFDHVSRGTINDVLRGKTWKE